MPAARFASVGLCAALFVVVGPTAHADPPPPPAADVPVGAVPDGFFLRTPGGALTLFPGGRLQVDGAFFPRQTPKSGVFIRRAQVSLRGWIGDAFYFDLGGDFAPAPPAGTDVAPSALPAADAYLAWAPLGDRRDDRLILQAGQFDAPFTLENRTSDAYTDFLERAMTARTLGAPRNKEVGVMVHGLLADRRLLYAVGAFNGEGPGFRNLDNQADLIGRVAVTPFAASDRAWHAFSIGGSIWYGDHVLGPEAPVQATPGGVVFFEPHWTVGQGTGQPMALHEQGSIVAAAGELNLPIGDRFGLRGELVWKRQHLIEADTAALPDGPLQAIGSAVLDGIAGYGEAWFWLLGDGRLLPPPGQELPRRIGPAPGPASDELLAQGLQLALRGEVLKEDLDSDAPLAGDPNTATTRVVSGTFGVNYWRGRLVRVSANYVVNYWSGTSETVMALVAAGRLEQEFLLRFALSL